MTTAIVDFTNYAESVKKAFDEVKACEVQGMHQTIFAGNCGDRLRSFCQLADIPASS